MVKPVIVLFCSVGGFLSFQEKFLGGGGVFLLTKDVKIDLFYGRMKTVFVYLVIKGERGKKNRPGLVSFLNAKQS